VRLRAVQLLLIALTLALLAAPLAPEAQQAGKIHRKEPSMDRRILIVASLALVALGGVAVPAPASDVINFDPKAFAAAQEAGEGIVVFVYAPW
jgi:hypothetical protein